MRITSCRICKNNKLVKIGSLGNIAVSDFTVTPDKGKKLPLTLIYCPDCTLLQLAHNFNRSILYREYWYQSHINKVIVDNLKEIASEVQGDIHIDIGGNDGTLLTYSKARVKISVDPSNIKPNGHKWIKDYFENITIATKATTITAIACLYDLPNPNKFMRNVKKHLANDGIFIAQLMTLTPMIEKNDVGNICHEHLEFYSYKSLVRLYEQNGLEIYKVKENTINGGSYRIFARHLKKGSIIYDEPHYDEKSFQAFFKRIEDSRRRMRAFIKKNKGRVYGYGASTKANTILQYYGVKLPAIVEVNPDKFGKYTIASKIPIINTIPSTCQYLWVFPYGFVEYFIKQEKAYLGRWVTSIPKFKLL